MRRRLWPEQSFFVNVIDILFNKKALQLCYTFGRAKSVNY